MEPIHLTYNELILYVVIIQVVFGILLGLIPLILGIKRKKRNYGVFGFFASIVGGAVSPLVCVIVVGIFTWLILKKTPAEKPAEVGAANEKPIEVNVSEPENN